MFQREYFLFNGQKRLNRKVRKLYLEIFDEEFYKLNFDEQIELSADAINHYHSIGWKNSFKPAWLFDPHYYLAVNQDIANANIEPLLHFLKFGWKEGRDPHPAFSVSYYLHHNPDVQKAGINPLQHFLQFGFLEGRNPHPKFDAIKYSKEHSDLIGQGVNPLKHFIDSKGFLLSSLPLDSAKDLFKQLEAPVHVPRPKSPAPRPLPVIRHSELVHKKIGDVHCRYLEHPNRKVGDGRFIRSIGRNSDHFWYYNPEIASLCDSNFVRNLLPDWCESILVIGHDFELSTGVMRPVSHLMNALLHSTSCNLLSIELEKEASASVARHFIETNDLLIINSLVFFEHDGAWELLSEIASDKALIYLHETTFIFDKLREEKPEFYEEFSKYAYKFNFLCVSKQQKDLLADRFNVRKAYVINNTTSLSFDDKTYPALESYKKTDNLKIIMAGTLQPRKGVNLFSEVADLAKKEGLPWEFYWAGAKVSDQVYLSPNVEYLGVLKSGEIREFISSCNVFFLSSIDDPFPLSCIEAIQAGKKTIGYLGTGYPELIDPGYKGAATFKQYNAKEAMKALKKVASKSVDEHAASRIAKKYSLNGFIKRFCSVLSELRPSNGRRSSLQHIRNDLEKNKVLVVLHIFYLDLWPEIRIYLENIRFLNPDLYVTLSEVADFSERQAIQASILKSWPKATILTCKNKGMDVGPFVEVLRQIDSSRQYDLILKLHSKKSIIASGYEAGTKWRTEIFESLLGSKTDVERILYNFYIEKQLGMIGPDKMLLEKSSTDLALGTDNNAEKFNTLVDEMDLCDREQKFFRGTMFWSRAEPLLTSFSKLNLTIDSFDEGYVKDGSLAHAFERVFACVIRSAGLTLEEYNSLLPRSIENMNNLFKGRDIYIIAAGASTNFIAPQFFEDKLVIGVNRVYTKFKCDYVIFKEYGGSENERLLFESGAIPIVSKWDSGTIKRGKRRPNSWVFADPRYIYFDHLENENEKANYEVIEPKSDKIIVSYSTITSAMHLAAKLGAKNIILVGHDCGTLDGKATLDGYYSNIKVSPWSNINEYKSWLDKIEEQSVTTKKHIVSNFNCPVYSLNPFINFGLEGHEYKRSNLPKN